MQIADEGVLVGSEGHRAEQREKLNSGCSCNKSFCRRHEEPQGWDTPSGLLQIEAGALDFYILSLTTDQLEWMALGEELAEGSFWRGPQWTAVSH